jgi:hypothetical protein
MLASLRNMPEVEQRRFITAEYKGMPFYFYFVVNFNNAFYFSSANSKKEMFKFITGDDQDIVNSKAMCLGETFLNCVIRFTDIDTFQVLIKHPGLDVNQVGKSNALECAFQRESHAMIILLLSHPQLIVTPKQIDFFISRAGALKWHDVVARFEQLALEHQNAYFNRLLEEKLADQVKKFEKKFEDQKLHFEKMIAAQTAAIIHALGGNSAGKKAASGVSEIVKFTVGTQTDPPENQQSLLKSID